MESTKNQKSVYVVEDDLSLSTVIDRVLKSIDSHVVLDWATTAEEAIQTIEQAKRSGVQKPYDLIIADIFLDGPSNGVDFWRQCKESFPDIPIILTSAKKPGVLFDSEDELPDTPIFLQKPFSIKECKKMFSSILNFEQ